MVNPYLGTEGVAPFLEYRNRGILILCRTSNPGSGDLQELIVRDAARELPFYEVVTELAVSWNTHGNVGLVAGAPYAEQARRIREIAPELPILVPGVGPQGGGAASRSLRHSG